MLFARFTGSCKHFDTMIGLVCIPALPLSLTFPDLNLLMVVIAGRTLYLAANITDPAGV